MSIAYICNNLQLIMDKVKADLCARSREQRLRWYYPDTVIADMTDLRTVNYFCMVTSYISVYLAEIT